MAVAGDVASTITLAIGETGEPSQPAFFYHVLLDEQLVLGNQSLSPAESRAVREFSRRYGALFEHRYDPRLDAERLVGLGRELFGLWLARAWGAIAQEIRVGAARALVVASDLPDVLNLPWELLQLPDGSCLGFAPLWSVRRLPRSDRPLVPFEGPLRPRPLRVLFVACAPQGQPPLDYEREERLLLRTLALAAPIIAVESSDMGTFDELRERVDLLRPHIVHLTGHGVVGRRCPQCQSVNPPDADACQHPACRAALDEAPALGYFAFEDDRGNADLRSSQEMRDVLAGSGVQCVFVSGCQTGKAPPVAAIGGICQGLVSAEVPLAVGWAASIADDLATEFAGAFYRTLAAGHPVDRALLRGRQAIKPLCEERGDPSWTLPVLYAATTQGPVFDTEPRREPEPAPRPNVRQEALSGMTEGHAEHFVGRRREVQRLLPALRDGTLRVAILTGLGGAGKSTLATRLARKLEAEGFAPLPLPSKDDDPLSAARILEACGDAFLAAGLRVEHYTVLDGQLDPGARLRYVVNVLNHQRFVLVLDNFEVNLDEGKLSIVDPQVALFYTYVLGNLTSGSLVIVTSRFRPADVLPLPPGVVAEPLGDFPAADFLKFLLRDPEVERRYRRGELPHMLLADLHCLLGGTPRFLDQMRAELRTMTADDLRRELAAVDLSTGDDPAKLAVLRDAYCARIFTPRLYDRLSVEAQRRLRQAAIYRAPINLDGLAAVGGETVERTQELAQEWQARAFIYPLKGGIGELWAIPGLVRGWLLARSMQEEKRLAHIAAASFLATAAVSQSPASLGLSPLEADLEARAHYLSASDYEAACTVTERVSRFLTDLGAYDKVIELNQELLQVTDHPLPRIHLASVHLERGQYDLAREHVNACLGSQGGSERQIAIALHLLASIEFEQGNLVHAERMLPDVLARTREIGDRAGQAATLHAMAKVDLRRERYSDARTRLSHALTICEETGEQSSCAMVWFQLGAIDIQERHYQQASWQLIKALSGFQSTGLVVGEASTLAHLGLLASLTGQREIALQLIMQGTGMLHVLGHAYLCYAKTWLDILTKDNAYTDERLGALAEEAARIYRSDRGWGLVRAAFPEATAQIDSIAAGPTASSEKG